MLGGSPHGIYCLILGVPKASSHCCQKRSALLPEFIAFTHVWILFMGHSAVQLLQRLAPWLLPLGNSAHSSLRAARISGFTCTRPRVQSSAPRLELRFLCGVTSAQPKLTLGFEDFPGGSSGKESTCRSRRHGRLGFDPRVGKISWRSEWQPTPIFPPGESHGQRSLAGYSPRGHKDSDTIEQLTLFLSISFRSMTA